jgi:hypothetical protein
VDFRVGLDDIEKLTFLTLSGLELGPPDRPARCQLLYRLRYHGSPVRTVEHLQMLIRMNERMF